MKLKFEHWLIVITVCLAVFARVYLFSQVPASTYWDETAILLDARSIAQTGKDWLGNWWLESIFPSYGDFKLPVYVWAAAGSVKVFGDTIFALRLPSLIAGLLSVWLSVLIAKELVLLFKIKLKSTNWLVWSILLTSAVSYWGIHFSHTAFEGHLGQMLLASSLYFSLIFFKKKKVHFLILSAALLFLAVLTYYSVRFVAPLLIIWFVFWQIDLHRFSKQFIVWTIVSAIAIILPIYWQMQSPYWNISQIIRLGTESILNSDQHIKNSNEIRQYFGYDLISRVSYHRQWFRLAQIGQQLSPYIGVDYLYLTGDHNLRHGTGEHGLFPLWFAPIMLVGLILLIAENPKLAVFLGGWWIISLAPAVVPTDVPHALRSLNAWMPIVMLHGFTLYSILAKFNNPKIFASSILLISSLTLAIFLYHYQTQYPIDSAVSWQAGYSQVAKFVLSHEDEYEQIFVQKFGSHWFLWLLINYPIDNFHKLTIDGFEIRKLDNIEFNLPNCTSIKEGNFLVVAEAKAIDQLREECQLDQAVAAPLTNIDNQPFLSLSNRQ